MSGLRALATLIAALMLVALLGLTVLGTQAGSAWLIGSLTELAGDRLSLAGVRGTLLEGLSVDRLQLSAGRTTIVIEPAELRMNWPDLLRRRVHLRTARADVVRIDIAPRPPDEPESVVQPLILPLAVVADSLEIKRLLIRNGVNRDEISTAEIVPVEIGPVTLRGELVDGVLKFESLRVQLYGFTAQARGTFGTGEPFAMDAQLSWLGTDPPVTGSGTLTGDLAALRFEQVVQLPSPVGVGGVIRLLKNRPEIVAEARWTNLERPFGKDPALLLRSASGRLGVRGWTDGYVADLTAALRLGDRPQVQVRATAAGDARQIRFPGIVLDGFGGQVAGNGSITLRDVLSGSVQLRGRQIDPRFLDPRLAGRVEFTSEVSFDAAGNFRVAVPEARGTLFSRPLRASGTVARRGEVLSFDDVRIHAGVNHLEASGQWGKGIAGRFNIDAPDLATLWPGMRGGLRGSGELGGTAALPVLDLDLTGSDLEASGLRVRALQARGGFRARKRLSLDVEADGLAYGGTSLGDLTVGIAGPLEAQSVEVVLTGGEVGAELRAEGSYRNGVITQTIGTGIVRVVRDRQWTLREPATVRLAGADVSITAHCWDSGAAELCLADSRSGSRGFSGGVDLRRLPLASLAAWLPADIGLAGTATASLTVQGDRARLEESLRGSLQASLSDAVITWRQPEEEDLQTEFNEFRVNVGLAGGTLDFDAAIAESFGLRLAATGRVTDPLGRSPTISARVDGGVPDLASLAPLLERLQDVGDLKGRITVAATLTGNARAPDIAGGVQLEEGAFAVPIAGITVDRISLALLGREDGQLALEGNARSGKGFVALDGTLAWRDQLVPTAVATVKGRVFEIIRLPEGLVQVSPDVTVVLRDRQFRVGGELQVPRAEIRLKKIAESAVQPSPDTIVHGRDAAVVEKAPPLFVLDDLRVRLGEKVSFEGFGLKTGLSGGLLLNQSVGSDPSVVNGTGVIALRDGKFKAFGRELEIDRGSLLFSGIVTDPGLDVKASREIDYEGREVTVGVLLSGNLSKIQTRLFSEPAMGELDVLSYLTTGKPLSAAGSGDRFSVANSAISLGLTQALPMAQQLGSVLKVDEVALDTTESGGTAVAVGEQLGKNLFIRYSYGIFDKLGTVKATYKLGRRMSIEGASGVDNQSLDLIYSVTW